MKEYNIILLILILAFIGCKNDNVSKKSKTVEVKSKPIKIDQKNTFTEFSQKDYSLVFQYSAEEVNQVVGINILDKKTIKFHLVTETLPCDKEYWGIAENKNWNRDGEIDEDEDDGYFVDEYFKEEKEYLVGIRLATDLSKVKIKYVQKDSLETDCLPIAGIIMKRIK
ncbi:hypothetical protein [Flavobacterium nackdongense]|uniref:Uncharacterized protein n=1 Tax=Flavobacterium nackdongense TaxID=2547394 RepID=A0A4P6Y8P1_9FLAO|nr:hypothetical protein [Flavobacterium nackdongense]QBN19239.1 hypothetical protein E1750_10635 [Flavobacterium nackdongense]